MAAVDALVSKVAGKLVSTIQKELRLANDAEEEIKGLTSNLRSVEAVLDRSGRRHWKEETEVQPRLGSLIPITCDIDDLVDERRYEFLRSKIENSRRCTWKVWNFIPPSACCCICSVVSRQVKIRTLNARLEYIASGIDRHNFQPREGIIECDLTVPIVNVSEVRGRDADKENLVRMLLSGNNEKTKLRPVSVVGMGGIGKTTLARLAYDDERVKYHFDKRFWVWVSDPFHDIMVAEAILESVQGENTSSTYFSRIIEKIQVSFVEGKEFLFVLDNVWYENLTNWKHLEYCLKGSFKSTVLVTTRNDSVGRIMGCLESDIFRIGLLSEEESWELFRTIAFSGRQPNEEMQYLETIGVEIVARCEGLPLAVKTIAGHLSSNNCKRDWESVLSNKLWKPEEVKWGLFSSLMLSYHDLPLPLKKCFLYCAVFPKGCRMSKDELISLWMAHDLLKLTKDEDMEMLGHDYFHDLGARSLFQDFEAEEKFNRLHKTYCTMHNILHDFSEFLMEKVCLHIDVNSAEEATTSMGAACNDDLYHLHVKLGEKIEFPDSFYNLRKLRSLFVVPQKYDSLIGAALPRIFNEFTCLRSLSLSRCHIESIPSNINRLIHLRWLKLSKNNALKELPETICQLYRLQTLSVKWCDSLINFPKGVKRLLYLRHLKNDYTYFLLPKGIGKLSGLRGLQRITIDPRVKDAFSLRDLKNLNNIGGSLTIFFMERKRVTLVEDAKQAQLEEKKHMTTLSLNFPERAAEEWMQQEDAELVEALKPPPSLEMLRITSYAGTNCPSCSPTLTSLKKLKLWYWSNCENLPALAKLPCLEYVEFSFFGRIKKVATEFYQMDNFMGPSSSTAPLFPKLKNLQFMNMIEWEEWSDYDGDEQVMPCLSYLNIENCPKLKKLPNFIQEKANLHKQSIR